MEYKKDFDNWNFVKKGLDKTNQGLSFYEKEIWMCSIGVNIGSEEDGKGEFSLRTVCVLKKINNRTFIGVPLTSSLKDDRGHVAIYFNYDLSTVIISQMRIIDRKRLFQRMGIISDYLYLKLKKATITFLSS